MSARLNRIGRWLGIYGGDRRGAAAVEFALVLGFLLFPIINVIDAGMYIFEGMELHAAADAAAQAALTTCGWTNELPATVAGDCAGLVAAESTAAQSTSLGKGVTISKNVEGYYCVDNSGVLQPVGTFPTDLPADCSAVQGNGSNDTPGDYLQISASYTYTPVFSGISVASSWTTPIVRTVWMRLQ